MRRGICGSYFNDLGLLSNFKSVRLSILLKPFNFLHMKRRYLLYQGFVVGHFW